MCLAAFAINASARWPLVIASNRDEFFNRPTLPLAEWQSSAGHSIISGRDLRAGGTWLGITPTGRIALLTNVREPLCEETTLSRGDLVMRWLQGSMDAGQFMAQTDHTAYGGFNLVLGDMQSGAWSCLSNRPVNGKLHCQPMANGVHGLSNAALNTPWPKTMVLKAAMNDALKTTSETPLWEALANRSRAAKAELPLTGLPLELETALSSAFVDAPDRGYGTRCTTLLVARVVKTAQGKQNWQIQVTEKTHVMDSKSVVAAASVQQVSLTLQRPNPTLATGALNF